MIYSIGSGQSCSGPLNISISGTDSGLPLTIDYIHSNVYCAESKSGAIELSASGGTPIYYYNWSTGDTIPNLFNLDPGLYTVTVTDAVDCTKIIDVEIGTLDPSAYNLDIAVYKGCGQCSLVDSSSTFLFLGAEYLVEVHDIYDAKDLEEVEVCIEFEESHLYYEGRPLLKRSWKLTSTNNKAAFKLFFTEDELMDLIVKAGYSDTNEALPSKMSIVKFDGGGLRPDDHEQANKQYNVKLNRFYGQDDIWYVEVPNLLFQDGITTSLYLEMVPTIISSTDPEVIVELDTELDFYVFSNPVQDIVRIGIDDPTHLGEGDLIIYDKLGREIQREPFIKQDLNGHSFNVLDYAPGIYFMVIRYKDREFTQILKFVKV